MQIQGSCAAKGGLGVLILGPPGSGKSDLVLRLSAHGFDLVADDRVDITRGIARPPPALEGLLEVRNGPNCIERCLGESKLVLRGQFREHGNKVRK